MLSHDQFEVDETWVAFLLNSSPIRTEVPGDFDCVTIMDAASGFLLCAEILPAPPYTRKTVTTRRLLKLCRSHNGRLPRTLLVAKGNLADLLTVEATRQGVEVIPLDEEQLLPLTSEPRREFAKKFEVVHGAA